ncbi:MAG: hypothetical protein QNK33_07755, partial [Bacteroidales bacterium]|nr:hypothetical protein [Bacteroidales bacterium]
MKKTFLSFIIAGLTTLMAISQVGPGKMTITTTSEKAKELFMIGRDLKENVEEGANSYLEKAIELDPDFAIAYAWRAWGGGKSYIEKAIDIKDKASKGEQ